MYLHQFIFTGSNLEPRVILAPCKWCGRPNIIWRSYNCLTQIMYCLVCNEAFRREALKEMVYLICVKQKMYLRFVNKANRSSLFLRSRGEKTAPSQNARFHAEVCLASTRCRRQYKSLNCLRTLTSPNSVASDSSLFRTSIVMKL